MIVRGLAVSGRMAPVGKTIFLTRINIATQFFLGATCETGHGRGTDHHQRDGDAGFSNARQAWRRRLSSGGQNRFFHFSKYTASADKWFDVFGQSDDGVVYLRVVELSLRNTTAGKPRLQCRRIDAANIEHV